jgi:hypothetical protein
MIAPGVPRFVRGHFYRLVRDRAIVFARQVLGYTPDLIVEFLLKKEKEQYYFKVLARCHSNNIYKAEGDYTSLSTDALRTNWSVTEVPPQELPLYLGLRTTRFMEQALQQISRPKRVVRGKPLSPILPTGYKKQSSKPLET